MATDNDLTSKATAPIGQVRADSLSPSGKSTISQTHPLAVLTTDGAVHVTDGHAPRASSSEELPTLGSKGRPINLDDSDAEEPTGESLPRQHTEPSAAFSASTAWAAKIEAALDEMKVDISELQTKVVELGEEISKLSEARKGQDEALEFDALLRNERVVALERAVTLLQEEGAKGHRQHFAPPSEVAE